MKNVLLWLTAFGIGFVGVGLYGYFHTQMSAVPDTHTIKGTTPQPTYALVPPSQAVAGVLTEAVGHVQKLSRNQTEYAEASGGAQILVGESVATQDNSSATASVSGIVSVSMGLTSEVAFANLFPTDIVLQQKNGKVVYTVLQPVSVRAMHSLISIPSGNVTITIIDTDMSVTVTEGSAKLAIVDTDNTTRVYDIGVGGRLNIDDANRLVYRVR